MGKGKDLTNENSLLKALSDKINIAKNVKIIGEMGEGTSFMDNSITLKKVTGFVVRHGYIVDGIRMRFHDGTEGEQHGSSWGGGEQTVVFDKDDSIVGLVGIKIVGFEGGRAISKLKIITQKGKGYGPFGSCGSGGEAFKLDIPGDALVFGCCGTSDPRGNGGFLTGIGFLALTKEKDGIDFPDVDFSDIPDMNDFIG